MFTEKKIFFKQAKLYMELMEHFLQYATTSVAKS